MSRPDRFRLLAMIDSHSPQALGSHGRILSMGRGRRHDQSNILRCPSTNQVWSEQTGHDEAERLLDTVEIFPGGMTVASSWAGAANQ